MKTRVILTHLLDSTCWGLAVCLTRLDYRFDSELRSGWLLINLKTIDPRTLNRRNQFGMKQRHLEPNR